MIHAAALAGTIIWLGLNGLLWYTRPSDLLWLLGSSILGAPLGGSGRAAPKEEVRVCEDIGPLPLSLTLWSSRL